MIHGFDTGFLVAAEVIEYPDHHHARSKLASLVLAADSFALTPQVLAEFIHIVTEPRPFTAPLEIAEAHQVVEQWWNPKEVIHVFPDDRAAEQFLTWRQQFSLGRKRLLDTLLAATYSSVGIHSLLTTNPSDFKVFGVFRCIEPR